VLTADLVRLRKRGEHHALEGLGPAMERELLAAAERIVAVGLASVGKTRGELELLRSGEGATGREKLHAKALEVVFDDASTFEGAGSDATAERRLELFTWAARLRREAADGAVFDRDAAIASFAASRSEDAAGVERELYADRRREERLVRAGFSRAEDLVARWELARVQAVLLRCTAITVTFDRAEPDGLRRLLRAMKFHQLLHTVELGAEGGAVVRVDGASSLFDATTKYGMRYATLVPAMVTAGASRILAEMKARPSKTFIADEATLAGVRAEAARLVGDAAVRGEIEDLTARFAALGSRFTVERSSRMLALEGVAVCVPDLDFVRDDGLRIAFELLGYWSRKAVWSRVEAVEAGLTEPALFAVSERLRVSKEVLPQDSPAALYVFKGTLRPKLVLEHLEAIAAACDARAAASIPPARTKRPRKKP
jgi:predicted nuclease of restriction endonuclease-like RecB superfamily